ncbi:TetR/AcrR family transcriptional regulator [uncultured Sphingomonas sp.]|uniref:TetR/AcrR family transcriptional regulator n=1 Tax=uncultured Sphingomonas sp. TaxID=158754 RepID=UPI0025E88495|nr:TetR/AcrR family transcriptional regulator [uncultured Sphingomonas sp.]
MTTAEPSTKAKRVRRTQEQRTADTRGALFAAAVQTIDRLGYAGANNASIADEAGVSRGAITHHFTTRAAFMAEVVRWVFEQETRIFRELMEQAHTGSRMADWPALLWDVFSRPSGVAVMEILVASRSDPELAALVLPMQAEVERTGAANFLQTIGGKQLDMSAIRLVVWAIRGMTMGRTFIADPADMENAVSLFSRLIDRAVPSGTFEDFAKL